MTIYLVGVEDHHTDLELTAFLNLDQALAVAKDTVTNEADDCDVDWQKLTREEYNTEPGIQSAGSFYLFMGYYTTEGDLVWVRAVEVQE